MEIPTPDALDEQEAARADQLTRQINEFLDCNPPQRPDQNWAGLSAEAWKRFEP